MILEWEVKSKHIKDWIKTLKRRLIPSRLMHVSSITLIWLRTWITMAQLQQSGPDEKEKTTALKASKEVSQVYKKTILSTFFPPDLLSRIDLDELMKKDEPPLEFPDTLEGFEYAFNERSAHPGKDAADGSVKVVGKHSLPLPPPGTLVTALGLRTLSFRGSATPSKSPTWRPAPSTKRTSVLPGLRLSLLALIQPITLAQHRFSTVTASPGADVNERKITVISKSCVLNLILLFFSFLFFLVEGQLRHIKTGEPFVFNYREDLHRWNQKRYEALGEIITKYVYELLEEECHLKKVYVPVDAVESEPRSFIFMSEDAMTNPDKLMVLIHGSGVVRAGQWARRLIINEDLNSGTQIPYIKRAIETVYSGIVVNFEVKALIMTVSIVIVPRGVKIADNFVYINKPLLGFFMY
ncbi:hypothetical protein EYD10_03887 [Varanus komodoensis]|nr:hypothetical protein EYD10_03887 [Varanus komodoensis]